MFDALNQFYYEMSLNELRLMNENTIYPNITYNSLLYLNLISYKESCTVSYLAQTLHISKSAVTIKVNELLKQGLVVKVQSERDRRVFNLSISPSVAIKYRQYDERLVKCVEVLEEHYNEAELETFRHMLELVRVRYLEETK